MGETQRVSTMIEAPRILIVSENASFRFGGEAALPLHYFRVLRERGFPVWLISHARTRDELLQMFPAEDRIFYVEDNAFHKAMWSLSKRLPADVAYITTEYLSRISSQLIQRRLVKRLVAQENIRLIHQPAPVSPREPSMLHGFGVPVVMGPMNGGMDYPPAFRRRAGRIQQMAIRAGRSISAVLNRLMPGKRRAACLIVANDRTRSVLPSAARQRIVEMVENGIDCRLWLGEGRGDASRPVRVPVTFVFMGRLVPFKAVDLLLQAYRGAARQVPMRLLVVGDGAERSRLVALADRLGVLSNSKDPASQGVAFLGWCDQRRCAELLRESDCLVLPSLKECGGAVVLEAMASAKPVIATAWGGPADYLDDSCGILIAPTSPAALIQGFSDAMVQLALSPAAREFMGERGRAKAVAQFDWRAKVDRILQVYSWALASTSAGSVRGQRSPLPRSVVQPMEEEAGAREIR